MAHRVLISAGSNISPRRNLPRALDLLAREVRVVKVSRVWETEPVGSPGAAVFLNAAILIETELPPQRLRRLLRRLETRLGRKRTADRNAPRTIDLDISLYGGRVIEEEGSNLLIPDPEILSRAHVAYPLAEAAPELRHPVDGRTLSEIAARLAPPGRPVAVPGWPAGS